MVLLTIPLHQSMFANTPSFTPDKLPKSCKPKTKAQGIPLHPIYSCTQSPLFRFSKLESNVTTSIPSLT